MNIHMYVYHVFITYFQTQNKKGRKLQISCLFYAVIYKNNYKLSKFVVFRIYNFLLGHDERKEVC